MHKYIIYLETAITRKIGTYLFLNIYYICGDSQKYNKGEMKKWKTK